MQDMLSEMFARLLADRCPPAVIRAAETGKADATLAQLWEEIRATGLCDSLLPESCDGPGLSLAEVLPLLLLSGRAILPLALAETMVARAILTAAGLPAPDRAIVLATALPARETGMVVTHAVPLALTAGFALVDRGAATELFAITPGTATPAAGRGSLSAHLGFSASQAIAALPSPAVPLRELAALLHAAKMAGAMQRLLEMTIDYSNTRVQFGRPIGKFQAIQHQLAVMAEQVTAAAAAVELACPEAGWLPDPLRVAVAKERTSAAAQTVAAIAHAVHGAMGISEEYDLQLFTHRLQEWRGADGADSYWAKRIGRAALASDAGSVIDFIRLQLA